MRRVGEALWLVGSAVIVLVVFGFFVGSAKPAPSNAVFFADDSAHEYLSPPCLVEQGADTAPSTRYREVRRRELPAGYRPNAECRDDGGFLQEDRSLTGHALQRLGVLDSLRSRWNADGTWRW